MWYRTSQANPVAVILPRVEWQAAYVTDYSRYDNDTPDANAIRREAAAAADQRISIVVAGSAVDATAQRATPTEIIRRPESPSLIPIAWTDAERRDAQLILNLSLRCAAPRGHLDRVRIMTAAVVMENVNWDPGKCK